MVNTVDFFLTFVSVLTDLQNDLRSVFFLVVTILVWNIWPFVCPKDSVRMSIHPARSFRKWSGAFAVCFRAVGLFVLHTCFTHFLEDVISLCVQIHLPCVVIPSMILLSLPILLLCPLLHSELHFSWLLPSLLLSSASHGCCGLIYLIRSV